MSAAARLRMAWRRWGFAPCAFCRGVHWQGVQCRRCLQVAADIWPGSPPAATMAAARRRREAAGRWMAIAAALAEAPSLGDDGAADAGALLDALRRRGCAASLPRLREDLAWLRDACAALADAAGEARGEAG